jgi:hypothetical protein
LSRVPKRSTEQSQTGPPPVLGIAEFAALLGWAKDSFMSRRGQETMARRKAEALEAEGRVEEARGVIESRGVMIPLPDWIISGNPMWLPKTAKKYGRDSGRLDKDGNPVRVKPGPRAAR